MPASASSRPRRRILWVGLTILLLLLGGGVWPGLESWRTARLLGRAIPVQPADLEQKPKLQAKIIETEERVRDRKTGAEGLGELGRLYQANGYPSESAQVFSVLCRIDPRNARWPYFLATTLAGYGRLDEALPWLEQVGRLQPGYLPARLQYAEALLKNGRGAEGRAVLEAVLQQVPDNTWARLGLVRLDVTARDWDRAEERLRELIGRNPEFSPAWALLATILENKGGLGVENARSRGLNSGLYVMPDPWLDELMEDCYDLYRLDVAAVSASASDPTQAVRCLQRAIRLDPSHAKSHRLLGKELQKTGATMEALRHFQRAIELQKTDESNWLALIEFLDAQGQAETSAKTVERSLAYCPQSHQLWFEQGRQLFARQRLDEALAALGKSRQLHPRDIMTTIGIGLIQLRLGRTAEGVQEMQAALKLDPGHPVALTAVTLNAVENESEGVARELIGKMRGQPRVSPQDLENVAARYQAKYGQPP